MSAAEISQRIKEIIGQVTGMDPRQIADEAHLTEELQLDSLSLLEIAVEVDMKLSLGLPDEHFRQVSTLSGMVGLVKERLMELETLPQAAVG